MRRILLLSVLLMSGLFVNAQKKYKIRTVAFYNLENLFDTINDTSKNDEASPMMELRTNKSKVYWDKIDKLGEVISQLGKEKAKTGPAILGVSEIENKQVLEDLVNSDRLKKMRYGIIHFDSPDKRGIDVALLYQQRYFKPVHYEAVNPNIFSNNRKVYTRDILRVSGYLDDELVHVIVNHWPSRRGGEAKSSPLREKAAFKVSQIINKIREEDKNAKVMIIGDFNDDPMNKSFKEVLKTKAEKAEVNKGDIYNPYEKMFEKGLNTTAYRDNLSLFDQILFTSPLLNQEGKKNFSSYKMFKSGIFNKRFMVQNKGRYKGYPFRSFSNGQYTGGYSDHFPVYIYLIKEKK
ncbi:endonuclease [Tenacibaculum sp. SZ-18]|uniref:endonuclease/exonuclease/phosphatase family protein n=1 Tax=Tenacibaculum sp. SZ-18 TaxID=754423 RepID=UPI000C2D68B3|nr:endonuclease [Tenacibaculum sp. SZ-18]AUC16357.1 endonuclease [Tenacibaculum sp. SZ-18]